MCKEGCFVACAPCEKHRNKSDGVVNLRHQCCECYFKDQHCMTEAGKACVRTLEDSKKKIKEESQKLFSINVA